MEKIIKAAVERGASDLHIKAGDVFRARIDGKLVPLTKQRLTPEQTRAIASRLIPNEEDRERLARLKEYDCSWGMPGVGRFRVNVLRQRSSYMIVMRVIPFDIPTFETLGLPAMLGNLVSAPRGLVVVGGTVATGKTSTMAALVHHINQTQQRHVITLENPIEYLHRDINSSVTQREVGVDTDSFRQGLRAALRQDPDVIVLSEVPDADTVEMALQAAETKHLVIAAVDTPDAATTVGRLAALFEPAMQEGVRQRVADALQAVVAQRLLPRADGQGRIAAVEVMICTPPIRVLLCDPARTGAVRDQIREGRDQLGMQTFEQHLVDLVTEGVVTAEAARMVASHPGDFDALLRDTPRQATRDAASAAKVSPSG